MYPAIRGGPATVACKCRRSVPGLTTLNAAGNQRKAHWIGAFNEHATVADTHDWGQGFNVLQSSVCVLAGTTVGVFLSWNDWYNIRSYLL